MGQVHQFLNGRGWGSDPWSSMKGERARWPAGKRWRRRTLLPQGGRRGSGLGGPEAIRLEWAGSYWFSAWRKMVGCTNPWTKSMTGIGE
jgi:hypothetical protein